MSNNKKKPVRRRPARQQPKPNVPRIKHLQTRVETIFGIEEGDDVIAQEPIVFTVQRFSKENLSNCYDLIIQARDDAVARSVAEQVDQETGKE